MKRLNTHTLYSFALRINPLTQLEYKEEMILNDVFLTVVRGETALRFRLESDFGFFSPSIKRSAGAVLRAIYALGINPDEVFESNLQTKLHPMSVGFLVQRAKEFETVLANELPGLSTYIVSPKGIYSIDDLILHAEMHIPEKYCSVLNDKAIQDIQQAGRCLAFEVATGSAFHMWRAVEAVMDLYYLALTGKTFAVAKVVRNWGKYVEALEAVDAEKKITSFLDHIREEYRNPISHPDDTLDPDEAFALFGAALSVIGQILREIVELREKKAAMEKALGGSETLKRLSAVAGDYVTAPPESDGGST